MPAAPVYFTIFLPDIGDYQSEVVKETTSQACINRSSSEENQSRNIKVDTQNNTHTQEQNNDRDDDAADSTVDKSGEEDTPEHAAIRGNSVV